MTRIDDLRLSDLVACLKTSLLGREIRRFEEVDSTNEEAKMLASQGGEEGLVVVADRQKLGRGRLGRRWYSPEGGLWFSVILRPRMKVRETQKLTLTAAVAVANTLRKTLGLMVEIKWPNDILINGRKVCGILMEAVLKEDYLDFVVVGIGINANVDRKELPKEVAETAITLKEVLGWEINKNELLCHSLKQLETYYKMLKEGKFNLILEEWRELALFLGKEIEVTSLNERMRGKAIDVDEDGTLILELKDGTRLKVVSGEILL